MDDIIIFSRDIEEQLHHVDEIITTLGDERVTLNLEIVDSSLIYSTTLAISSSLAD